MIAYNIGASALRTGQTALDVIGQNIANANTPGYDAQNVSLISQVTGTQGNGVSVAQVTRSTDNAVQDSIYQSNGDSALLASRLSTQQQAQSLVDPGSDAIDTQLTTLFNNITQLTSNPSSAAQQAVVVSSAQSLRSSSTPWQRILLSNKRDLDRRFNKPLARLTS